ERRDAAADHGRVPPHRPPRSPRALRVQADALHPGGSDGRPVIRLLLVALLVFTAGDVRAQGTFLVGAAKVDVTPPPFDAAADAAMFPTCPAAVFPGPRSFGLQGPFGAQDGAAFFNSDAAGYCASNANGAP